MGNWHPFIFLLILATFCVLNLIASETLIKFPDDSEIFNSTELIVDELKRNIFNPIVLLIEDRPDSFRFANFFAENIFLSPISKNFDFWIITFNATGTSNVIVSSKNNIKHFKDILTNLTSESYVNQDRANKTLPFFATLHAAQILPKNSTIVSFSQAKVVDENLAQLAFNAVYTKNITVHLYFDEIHLNPNNLLKEISRLSGGQLLNFRKVESPFENYQTSVYQNSVNSRLSILLTRKNQKHSSNLRFTVDSDVIGIYLSIVPWIYTTVSLTSPTGHLVQISDDDKKDEAKKYSFGSFSEHQDQFLDVYLNFLNSARPTVGLWNLKIDNPKNNYNVTVYGLTNITTQAFLKINDRENAILHEKSSKIKVGVTGDIRMICDITFLENDGQTTIANTSYTNVFNNDLEKLALKDVVNNTTNFEVESISGSKPTYALVKGLDAKGNKFERLGHIFGFKSNLSPQQTLSVDVGVGSQLLIVPGEQAQIYFEVSNRGNDIINVFFFASATRRIFQSISANRRFLNPQESYIVTLTFTRQATSGSYQDEITFTAKGGGQIVTKKAIVDIGANLNNYDRSEPYLDHTYTSDCTEVIFKRCEQGTWTIEVTAQDTDSGILQVNSVPKGLYFPNPYTAGTLDRVVGYYSESCCNPDLQIIAIDRANNRRSYNVNAYHAIWSPGAIAALIFGILLFILLIALIVFLICRCRKKKETYDLPTYRGGDI